MTHPLERDFPNIERLIAHIAAPLVGGINHVGSRTPPDLEDWLPFVRVRRIDGQRTHLYDYPVVNIDFFDLDESDGEPAASRLANVLLAKPPPHPSIDLATCPTLFREVPWGDNENIRRWEATFWFETRQVRVPLFPLPLP